MHGRLILPALRWRDGSGFAHEEETIDAALAFGAGGFILFGGEPEAVARLTAELRRRAGRPLLMAADLERGAGQQFPGRTEFPPPAALAFLNNPDVISVAATTTAREALELGVNWVLAPDADLDIEPANPIVQTRSFGADPEMVAVDAGTWARRCQEAGALACVKHFPGHGRTTTDSHDEVPTIAADLATLEKTDLVPFRIAISAGVASVMTGHLRVPALDPSGTPATFSVPIIRYLREELHFDGLVVTDALMMGAAVADARNNPAVRALAAGCDLLCYPADPAAAFAAIGEALQTGVLSQARIDSAVGRYEVALALAARGPAIVANGGTERDARWVRERANWARWTPEVIADRLFAQGVVRGSAPTLQTPVELLIIDDDQDGAWPASPNDYVEQALRSADVPLGSGGSRIVLAFAEPRASKGRAGFGAASLEALSRAAGADLIIVFGHPRLTAEVPGSAPVMVAWHRQRLMQEAAARWIAGRLA